MKFNWRTLFSISLLGLSMSVLIIFPVQLPEKVGVADFRPYWSSSYLLVQGRNFGDSVQLDKVERTLTGWDESFTMYAWFAPTGNLILIPYTYLPFSLAVFYWLITSTLAIAIGSILIWPHPKDYVWVPIVITFSYSMTLVSLADGQVNTVEFLGLALYLAFSRINRNFMAGMSLILTTIKPHLVIITLPLLVLDMVSQKKWRVLSGFFTALMFCAIALTMLYPHWFTSFWQMMTFGMNLTRETPTVNGLLVIAGQPRLGGLLWLFTLACAIILWIRHGKEWNKRTMIDITILAGLTVSPVGWSYDQVMLLFPILRVFEWISKGDILKKIEVWSIIATLFIANGFSYYQRNLGFSDAWFFWVPLLVACVYIYVHYRMTSPNGEQERLSPA